jgi:hypothetical protein
MINNSLVNSFVSTANQNNMRDSRKLSGHFLRPETPLGGQKHYPPVLSTPGSAAGFHRVKKRPRHKNHAFAAAVRAIIDRPMPVTGEIPQIHQAYIHKPRLSRPANNTAIKHARKQFGTDAYDIKPHFTGPSILPADQ